MESKLKWSAFGVQTLAALCISFLGSQTGFICSWPSYNMENFTSNETILATPMTPMESYLLGSVPTGGALLASPFCGYMFNTLGRKYATVFYGFPYVFAWIIIALTTNPVLILIAMALSGIGIAGQNVSLIFISEISHDSIRGGLTACSATGYFIGILVSYINGGCLSYYQVVYTHLTLSVICVVLLLLLKESPVYLILVGKEEEAAKSIAFYNQVDYTCKTVEVELKKIKLQIDPRFQEILQSDDVTDIELKEEFLKKQDSLGEVAKNESAWKLLIKSKSSRRALFTVLTLIASTIMMGSVVLQVYAESLFKEAVPSLSPKMCSIINAVVFVVASIVCVLVVDNFGRKNLLFWTSAGSGVCTLLLGIQMIVDFAPSWFTVILIYLYSFLYTVGCAVIPFVLAAEVFLPEIRGLCNSICMVFVWLFTFLTLFTYGPLAEALSNGPVFCGYSLICFFGAGYTRWRLPETKGLSVDAIQLEFLKRR